MKLFSVALCLVPTVICLVPTVIFAAACAGEPVDESTGAQDSALGEVFRSPLHELGALPLEPTAIRYPEDPRPFEQAYFGVSQTAGQSPYVAYRFDARKGDGVLLVAGKTSTTTTDGACDEVTRIWLLDQDHRVVRAGAQKCAGEYEVPGLQATSKILRHYVDEDGSYTLVVAVLPAKTAPAGAPIRTQPWQHVGIEVIRSHEENQGAPQSRCQDGVDILCRSELRCERARCK
jgi:hypothetical protein